MTQEIINYVLFLIGACTIGYFVGKLIGSAIVWFIWRDKR